MRLTVVGCSGTFPGPASPCSSYLFEADGFRLLVDVGNGSIGALQSSVGLLDIDAVVLSHMHGDHYLDLVNYTYARRYHPDGCPAPLPVYGPHGVREHIASAFGGGVDDLLDAAYQFTELAPGRAEIGPFALDLARMHHPVETLGMRITHGGSTAAYSADTGECDELVQIARDVDLFLCEASYLHGDDNPVGVHLTGHMAGEYAVRAGAQRLVLTHLVPWGDQDRTLTEAHRAYDGEIHVARTHAVYEL